MVIGTQPRFVLVGWAILETMLFGSLINGWASLVFVLKEDGLYSDLCRLPAPLNASANTTDTGGAEGSELSCKAQDNQLNLWFTIAITLRNIYGIVIGFHIFKFGTRSARLTGWVLFVIGALMMAFADKANPWLVLPALMTVSYGGVTLLLTNVQISCLFPRAAGVVVTLVSGGFDFSASTQLAVKMLYESGLVSRMHSYLGMAGLHIVMVLISTLCFLPKGMMTSEADDNASHLPPQPDQDLRKRRDSLYDWSEINVPGHHHSLKCLSCEDSSSDAERKELGVNHAPVSDSSPQHNDLLPMQRSDPQSLPEEPDQIPSLNGSHPNQPSAGRVKTSLSQNRNGTHDFNPNRPIFTISQAVGKAGPRIKMSSFVKGKFVSVIHVRCAESEDKSWDVTDPQPQEDEERREPSSAWECGGLVGEGGQEITPDLQPLDQEGGGGGRRGHAKDKKNGHKVRLDLSAPDKWSAAGSSRGGSEETGERKDGERNGRQEGKEEEEEENMFPTLKSCLKSTVFWLHVGWFSINVLRLVTFFGFINTKLTTMFHGDKDKVSFYTNVQAYFLLGVLAVCWTSGALYDWQILLFKGRKTEFERTVLPGALPMALTSALGVVITALWMIDSETALYVMFALLVFYNAFIFGVCISFLLAVFPAQYFGILNGVASIISGPFCLLQYALFIWDKAYPQAHFHTEIFFLTLGVLSFIHPLYIVIKSVHFNASPCCQQPVSPSRP